MGKKIRHQESPNVPLQNGNSGCVNKLLHELDRRHRWKNVRKVLPNKRQGSGKHIIDGGNSETTSNSGESPEVPKDMKKDKQQNEQASMESTSVSKKSSNKSRIRSLISEEMSKRRGKHQRRRSSSPNRSPNKQNSSGNRSKHGQESVINRKPSPTATRSSCGSPSTIKKRKCDICAAMLTVSYLRQKGLDRKPNIDYNRLSASPEMVQSSNIELTKSHSYPSLGTSKRRDFEVEELKQNLRDCKDIETVKNRFISPINRSKDSTLLPKPMLTRPASFKNPSSTSRKEKKQAPNNSKSLKQKLSFVNKDNRKEKRMILMDAVFHKIPYGRRSSKDAKKVDPEKLKSSSNNSRANHQQSGDKARLMRRKSSTNEAMSKYRKLLSQTSTRNERCHHKDHKPRLFVAVDVRFGANDRKTLKRVHSLPSITPNDFKDNEDFRVKKASALFDNQKSSDQFKFAEKIIVPDPAKESVAMEDNSVDKCAADNETLGVADHQENIDHENEVAAANKTEAEETKLVDKDEAIETNLGVDLNESDKPENDEHKKELSAAVDDETTAMEPELVDTIDEDPGVDLNESDREEKVVNHDENESSAVTETAAMEPESVDKDEAVDESPGRDLNTSDHQENENESRAASGSPTKESPDEKDKSFNEILGMFKKVSDQRLKSDEQNEPSVVVQMIDEDKAVDKVQGVDKYQEVAENPSEHQEKEETPLTSGSEVECSMKESVLDSSSLIDTPSLIDVPNSSTKDISDENQQHLFSIHDQPSTDDKQPNNSQPMIMSAPDDRMMGKKFLHLDLESLKDNREFQYVKQVLERLGFLEKQLVGDDYSSYQPIDPVLFEELETNFLQTKNLEVLDSLKDEETVQKIIHDQHLLLFDLINEALLEIHNRTFMYCPQPLTICSKVRPMPVGRRVLEEVWDHVNVYLNVKQETHRSLDDIVSRDLRKGDGWMNLQADAEFVGVELEEMIADDLLDELVFDDLLM